MENNKPQITSTEIQDWENKFKEAVSPQVQFEVRENGAPSMQLYNGESGIEAIWTGTILLNADNYIKWSFSIQNNPFIEAKASLTEENFQLIKKLYDFYGIWKEEWSKQLTMPNANADDTAMATGGDMSAPIPAAASPGGMRGGTDGGNVLGGATGSSAGGPPVNENRKSHVQKRKDGIIEEHRERMLRLAKLWK